MKLCEIQRRSKIICYNSKVEWNDRMAQVKKHIKKILSAVAIVAVTTGVFTYLNRCKLDGTQVCYDKKMEVFKIEEEATLNIQVENEALGEYLVNTWNTIHQDHQDKVTYTVKAPLNLTQLADNFETDVIVTSLNNAAYVLNDVHDLGKDVEKVILTKSSSALENAINSNGEYFIPNSVSGWTFVYNKTLAEKMDLDLSDENKNGLPDVFETWENLFELSDEILKELDIVFPLSFKDQYSFYPFLTSGKWHLNFTNIGNDAGFSQPEFLRGLEFIEYLSNQKLLKDELPADKLKWQYNTAFFNEETLFSIVTDWMNFEYYQDKTESEYVIAPLPSFQSNTLRPKGSVDGYLVSKSSKYPSAATEALRILRTNEAFKHYESGSDKVFVYHRNFIHELEGDTQTIQKIRALNYIDPDPVMVLEDAPSVLSRSFLYEVDFMEPLKDLYDKKISKEEAQIQIDALYKSWVKEKVGE